MVVCQGPVAAGAPTSVIVDDCCYKTFLGWLSSHVNTTFAASYVCIINLQWVRHMSSEEAPLRSPYIRDLLSRSRATHGYGLSPQQFDATMQQVTTRLRTVFVVQLMLRPFPPDPVELIRHASLV